MNELNDNQQRSFEKINWEPGVIIACYKLISKEFSEAGTPKWNVICTNCGEKLCISQSLLRVYFNENRQYCKKCKPKTPIKYNVGDILGNCYELLEFLGGQKWKIKCTKCGKEDILVIGNILKHKSDKCYYCDNPNKKRRSRKHFEKMEIDERIYTYYKGKIESDNRLGRKKYKEFNLTLSEFTNLIHSNCYYCGSEPTDDNLWNKSSSRKNDDLIKINGIDRIDSNKGYLIDNCVPCCKHCNKMKSDNESTEFLNHVYKIYNFQKTFNGQSKDVAPSGCEMESSEFSDEDMVSSI